MSRYFRRSIFVLYVLLGIAPLACVKTYTVGPLPAPTPIPTPTNTPTCVPIFTPIPCPAGIYWGFGEIVMFNQAGLDWSEVHLAVNCAPESTAGLTLTGPGVNTPYVYSGPVTTGGQVFARYNANFGSSLAAGNSYTLTSVTSIGTASASLLMPPLATSIAADGSSAIWPGPSMFNWVIVYDNGTGFNVYHSDLCVSAASPFSIPATVYSAPGTFTVDVRCANYTTNITGGAGLYLVESDFESTLVK